MSDPSDAATRTSRVSFPSYAELAETNAWRGELTSVDADPTQIIQAAEVSQTSRYSEGSELGVGGMGKVVLARDARIGREVALKVMHADRELDPYDRARFLREARVQGQLEHPSIVPVYDIDRRSDGTTFFTMRRVLGRTLAAILDDLRSGVPAAKARYTRRELLTAFATVCLAIDYAHSRGVVHRDLKPANIMLGDFGEVYVLDWGLARLLEESETGQLPPSADPDEPIQRLSVPGSVLGTPLYMAPEQMGDPQVGPSADVFALGAILFEILTLERVRDPKAMYAPVEARPSVRAPHCDVPPELEVVCVNATAFEEADRYPTARALHEALSRYLDGDRELEQRRLLAATHVDAARVALAKTAGPDRQQQHAVAMSELTRAVALDPRNEETVAMLADMLAHPPPEMPPAIAREYAEENLRILKLGAQQSLIAMVLWVIALPVLLLIGLEDASQLLWLAVPLVLTVGMAVAILRSREVKLSAQYASVTLVMLGGAMLSRLYGPFILAPVIISTNALVLQVHPLRQMQRFSVHCAIGCLAVVIAVEWLQLLPVSYAFADDGMQWTIVPQLIRVPRDATFAFLTVSFIATILLPCALIAKLRNELTDAQLRLATHAWHLKQLGARLTRRAS